MFYGNCRTKVIVQGVMDLLITITILFFTLSPVSAQAVEKPVKDGIAVQIGTGPMYGGNGGSVEYQILLKENFYITPYAGLGVSKGGTETSTTEYYWLNYAVGFNLEYGKKHRLIIGPQCIGGNNIFNNPANASIDKKELIGFSFIVGYKGTASYGLTWKTIIGLAYIQNPLINDNQYFFEPHVSLGIGYKF